MSDEYISQEAIKNALVDKFKARIGSSHVPTWNDAFDAVTNLPAADVVEVVRCYECAYHDDKSQYHYCRKWRRNCPNDSDFFCKWGKRKDGEQDDG